MSNLTFFYLFCTFHTMLDKQVDVLYESGDLVNKINRHACVWCPCANEDSNLRFLKPDYYFGSTNTFNIAEILHMSILNRFSDSKQIADLEVSNAQIWVLKIVCISRRLPGQLAIEQTWHYLRFTIAKRGALHLLFFFKFQEDMDRFFQPFVIGKFSFITRIKSDELVSFTAIVNINSRGFQVVEKTCGLETRLSSNSKSLPQPTTSQTGELN